MDIKWTEAELQRAMALLEAGLRVVHLRTPSINSKRQICGDGAQINGLKEHCQSLSSLKPPVQIKLGVPEWVCYVQCALLQKHREIEGCLHMPKLNSSRQQKQHHTKINNYCKRLNRHSLLLLLYSGTDNDAGSYPKVNKKKCSQEILVNS